MQTLPVPRQRKHFTSIVYSFVDYWNRYNTSDVWVSERQIDTNELNISWMAPVIADHSSKNRSYKRPWKEINWHLFDPSLYSTNLLSERPQRILYYFSRAQDGCAIAMLMSLFMFGCTCHYEQAPAPFSLIDLPKHAESNSKALYFTAWFERFLRAGSESSCTKTVWIFTVETLSYSRLWLVCKYSVTY